MVSAVVSAYKTDLAQLAHRLNNLADQGIAETVIVCQKNSPEHQFLEDIHISVPDACLTDDIPTVYGAWNIGIRNSKSEFITNANSDDVLYPGALRYLEGLLKENPEYALVYGNSDIVTTYHGYPVGRYEWMEGCHEELLGRCFIGPMPVWRRSLHEKYGFFDEEMHSAGDYEFWLRIASLGEKFLHSRRCVGAFLSHPDSASRRESVRSLWEGARARSRYPLSS